MYIHIHMYICVHMYVLVYGYSPVVYMMLDITLDTHIHPYDYNNVYAVVGVFVHTTQ